VKPPENLPPHLSGGAWGTTTVIDPSTGQPVEVMDPNSPVWVEGWPPGGGPPVSAPIGPPVSAPVAPPVSAPVAPPVSAPVAPPVSAPVAPPVSAPVAPPVSAPVAPPVSAPVAPPVSAPVAPPVSAPVAPPVSAPVAPPQSTSETPPEGPPSSAPEGPAPPPQDPAWSQAVNDAAQTTKDMFDMFTKLPRPAQQALVGIGRAIEPSIPADPAQLPNYISDQLRQLETRPPEDVAKALDKIKEQLDDPFNKIVAPVPADDWARAQQAVNDLIEANKRRLAP
jgi:hypothetical protein